MKVAISTDRNKVSPHFGRCPQFTIIEIENNKLVDKKIIENPGHHPGYLPQYLNEIGVSCIIAGGMGMRAKELFSQTGIEAVLGVEGDVEEIIGKIIDGSLEGGESICQPGLGKGYGIEKTECDHD
ncbi:MAG: NifB/NifX family molybdenum-iron cluster-binding protein [Actinobacteria bacterium]|nr:NifB/NifX family molybdenum-iron cluster-binding protein [Actinomycetota bacterium]